MSKKTKNKQIQSSRQRSSKSFFAISGLKVYEIHWTRTQRLFAIAAFLIPLLTYVIFLCPTIAAGDSAEFVTASKILGIPHPPGYPLYTLIGHLFTKLPFNSVAWRVNLSSAVFGALACFFVYLSLLRLTGRNVPALAAAFGLAFSRYFWHYAEVAEVFVFNSFFAALLTYVLILIAKKRGEDLQSPVWFWLLAFLFGLALTNHHTIILLAPAMLFLMWKTQATLLWDKRNLAYAALFFCLGLTPYLYCPIAASAQPAVNWDNPNTLSHFIRLVTRADYGSFSLFAGEGSVDRSVQLPAFFKSFPKQMTPLGVFIALLGLFNFKRYKVIQIYLLLAFILSGIFFVVYANMPINNPLLFGVLHRFYILPTVFAAFWIGLGFERIFVWLQGVTSQRVLTTVAPVSLLLILGIWELSSNIDETDFRENTLAEDFAHNLLLSLPENSLFFVRGDVASLGVDYLQIVQKQRPDVKILDQAKLTYDWYYEQAKKRFPKVSLPGVRYDGAAVLNRHFTERNIGRFPVCFMDFKEQSYQEMFRAVPHGLVYLMLPKSERYSVTDFEEKTNAFYKEFRMRGLDKTYSPTTFEYELKQIYAEPFFRLGYEFEQAGSFAKAEQYYKKVFEINPNSHKALKNLAVLYYYKMNRRNDAIPLFKRYLEMNPFDVDAHSIKQVIESHR
ncbi:MAG: protein O-mannosyl-transferase family [bacterium]